MTKRESVRGATDQEAHGGVQAGVHGEASDTFPVKVLLPVTEMAALACLNPKQHPG